MTNREGVVSSTAGSMWSRKHLYRSIRSSLGGTRSRLFRHGRYRRSKRRSECGDARREGGDTRGNIAFSVLRKSVKLSADEESLSSSKDAGEVHNATSMIPKKRRPSIDEFGFRSAPEIRKSHSGLTSVDTAKRQAEANLAGDGSGSARHCRSVQ
jgi:hypothetical protein